MSRSFFALGSKYAEAGANKYLSSKVSNNPFSVIFDEIPLSSPISLSSLIYSEISLKESSSYLGLIYSTIKEGINEFACCWSKIESLPSIMFC